MLSHKKHVATALAACALLLSGCGVAIDSPTPSAAGIAISGRVRGGQQPVSGAVLSLYAAGSAGLGQGATSLLRTPVSTGLDGSFNITNDYTCPSGTAQVYLVARGGNPGLGKPVSNLASVMMVALGDCGNLSASTFINLNEVTTAAATWALAPFLANGAVVGATATNPTGLRNAFLVAANLANNSTGFAPGAGLAAGAVVETAKVNTLADILSPCVNSDGGSGCAPLFNAATFANVVPTNTLDAALSIVRHPSFNVATVFNAAPSSGPFQPALARVPNDWTMTITYRGGGLAMPTALGVDSIGNVWVANYNGVSVSEFSPLGVPAAAAGFPDPALFENYGLTIDPQDNVWVTNEEGNIGNYNGSVSKFNASGTVVSGNGITSGGVYYPYAIAADTDGSVWVADFGRSTASHLASDTSTLAGAGYTSSNLPFPTGVALDGAHNAWFAASASAVRVTPGGQVSQSSCCRGPSSIAVDQNGNVWVSDYAASSIVEINASGVLLQSLNGVGGVTRPQKISIDGVGTVWTSNYRGNSISAIGSATGGAASAIISPSTGFGVDASLSSPFGTALDASGNVWVTNFSTDSLTQFVGLASPIKTPTLGPPVAP